MIIIICTSVRAWPFFYNYCEDFKLAINIWMFLASQRATEWAREQVPHESHQFWVVVRCESMLDVLAGQWMPLLLAIGHHKHITSVSSDCRCWRGWGRERQNKQYSHSEDNSIFGKFANKNQSKSTIMHYKFLLFHHKHFRMIIIIIVIIIVLLSLYSHSFILWSLQKEACCLNDIFM